MGQIAILFAAIVLISISSQLATAQQVAQAPGVSAAAPTNQQMTPAGGDTGAAPFDIRRIMTRFEFWLSLLILAFGTAVVGVEYALLRKRSFDGNDILKVFGITLIVVGTLFLIASGFGDKQIAPAMGLFGTLAGYILGKASGSGKASDETDKQ
jgi:hypothetical protein